ncbi:MAG: hypothetical protein LQ337_003546 [Flavoplaca oasis]|nr:MAG: hypothetical protein LQ337_003546 [Flavoplaca oasis]
MDIARNTVERRHDHLNQEWFDWADKNIQDALYDEDSEEEWQDEDEEEEDEEDDIEEENEGEEPPMNIESIPQYDPTVPASDSESSSSTMSRPSTPTEAASSSVTSDSTKPEPVLPLGKKARRRLARKESNKVPVKEEVKEVQLEEKEEDLSALSWLQVECGYGGDLNGQGR